MGLPCRHAAVSAGLVLVAYGPVLVSDYGYNDDYHMILRANQGGIDTWMNEYTESGRPFLGVLLKAAYSAIDTIHDLRWGRCISLLGIVAFSGVFFILIRAEGGSRFVRVLVPLLTILSPGFAVYAVWFVCVPYAYVGTLALLAGALIWHGIGINSALGRIGWCGMGMTLLIAVYATYPPLAAFAVLAIFVRAWNELDRKTSTRPFLYSVGVTLASAGCYFVAYKVMAFLLGLGGQAARSQITTNIGAKAAFIFGQIFRSGFAFWGQFYGNWTQWVTIVLTLSLVTTALIRKMGNRYRVSRNRMLAVLLILPLSILPMIILKEQHPGFRTQIVLHATILFLAITGIDRWISRLGGSARLWGRTLLSFVGCALFAGAAHQQIVRGLVKPNTTEIECLRKEIAERFNSFPERVVFLAPAGGTRASDNIGEFNGGGSSHMRWVSPALLHLLFLEKFPAEAGILTVFAAQPQNEDLDVINGFALIHQDPGLLEEDPYWGTMRHFSNGWASVEWLGYFDNRQFPQICHPELGWMFCAPKESNGFSFYHRRLGWLWTSPESFPNLKRSDDTWIFYSRQIGGSLAFYDYTAKEWFAVAPY